MPSKVSPKVAIGGSLAGASAIALVMAVTTLKPDEGKRNVDYLDIVKVPTACYGHTGPDVRVGRRRSDAECEALLTQDAQIHMAGVLRCTPVLANRPHQLAAATRITFNIGVGGYCRSTMARRFNAGQWRAGCDAFLAWNKAGGRVVRGLVMRRQRERAMCLAGVAA
jgi:lysozyme